MKQVLRIGEYFVGYKGSIEGIWSTKDITFKRRVVEGEIKYLFETRDFGWAAFKKDDGTTGVICLG